MCVRKEEGASDYTSVKFNYFEMYLESWKLVTNIRVVNIYLRSINFLGDYCVEEFKKIPKDT